MSVQKGDRYRWGRAIDVRVDRVAKDGSWADIFVYDNSTRTSWTKRQPLPFADGFVPAQQANA